MEIFRHNADDGVGFAVESDCFADFIAVAVEAVVPKAVAEDYYVSVAGLFFFGAECAAHDRLGFESFEKIGADTRAENSFGAIFAGEVEIRGGPGGKIVENGVLGAPVVEIWGACGVFPALFGVNLPEDSELVGMREGDGVQHPLSDHIEEQRAAGDAERESDDDEDGDAGGFCQRADPVAQVLQQGLHRTRSSDRLSADHLNGLP